MDSPAWAATYVAPTSRPWCVYVHTEEVGEWNEDGQIWRRLGVRYPANIATHSAEQILYVDTDGLLRRRDYVVDIAAGSAAAHYMDDHREFDGIVLPVKRVVYARTETGHPVRDMVHTTRRRRDRRRRWTSQVLDHGR